MSVVLAQKAMDDLIMFDDGLIAAGSSMRASLLVISAAEHLGSFPNWGPPVSDRALAARGFRKLLCRPYIAYYRVNEAGDVVIHRVFHQLEDYLGRGEVD